MSDIPSTESIKGLSRYFADDGTFIQKGFCKHCKKTLGKSYRKKYTFNFHNMFTGQIGYFTGYCEPCAKELTKEIIIDQWWLKIQKQIQVDYVSYKPNGLEIVHYKDGSELESLSLQERNALGLREF